MGVRPYDFNDNIQLALEYELNFELLVVKRSVYSLLDLLGDIGGLAGSLYSFFFALIIIMQYKAAISAVSNHTFMIRDGDEKSENQRKATIQDTENSQSKTKWKRLPISFFQSIRLSLQRLFYPVFCGCFSRCFSRHDKLSHYSDKLASEEMKIVRWIRLMRVTEVTIRRLFTKQQLDEIFEESIYRYIQFKDDSMTPEETQKLHQKTDQTLLLSKRSEVDGSKA